MEPFSRTCTAHRTYAWRALPGAVRDLRRPQARRRAQGGVRHHHQGDHAGERDLRWHDERAELQPGDALDQHEGGALQQDHHARRRVLPLPACQAPRRSGLALCRRGELHGGAQGAPRAHAIGDEGKAVHRPGGCHRPRRGDQPRGQDVPARVSRASPSSGI